MLSPSPFSIIFKKYIKINCLEGGEYVFLKLRFSGAPLLYPSWIPHSEFENILTKFSFQQSAFGYSPSDVHIIGHSLGSHAAGEAGRRTNGTVGRITGWSKHKSYTICSPHGVWKDGNVLLFFSVGDRFSHFLNWATWSVSAELLWIFMAMVFGLQSSV